jgi:hypothetical protein
MSLCQPIFGPTLHLDDRSPTVSSRVHQTNDVVLNRCSNDDDPGDKGSGGFLEGIELRPSVQADPVYRAASRLAFPPA